MVVQAKCQSMRSKLPPRANIIQNDDVKEHVIIDHIADQSVKSSSCRKLAFRALDNLSGIVNLCSLEKSSTPVIRDMKREILSHAQRVVLPISDSRDREVTTNVKPEVSDNRDKEIPTIAKHVVFDTLDREVL